jgi:allantoicase
MSTVKDKNRFEQQYTDLLNERCGGQAIACSDEFFAEKENMVKTAEPIFQEGVFTDRGQIMDGWESRRRRDGGYDWAILQLGLVGKIRGVNVNTTHFKGNAPGKVTLEACHIEGQPNESTEWTEIISMTDVQAHFENLIDVDSDASWSHVRLNIFPDGGVARLRVYGEPTVAWDSFLDGELVDLALAAHGGRAIACSDMFFSDMNNLLQTNRGVNMGDGWETKRRRGPGNDWVVVRLGRKGAVKSVEIDTNHFKGNFPDSIKLEATTASSIDDNTAWTEIISQRPAQAHRQHFYRAELSDTATEFTHVRLSVYPDGGVSRLRINGVPSKEA